MTQTDGTFRQVATQDISLMGADYAHYTPDGGVECYVVEARARADWIPDYARPRLVYWLEKRAFYPLRTEMYDGLTDWSRSRCGAQAGQPGAGRPGLCALHPPVLGHRGRYPDL